MDFIGDRHRCIRWTEIECDCSFRVRDEAGEHGQWMLMRVKDTDGRMRRLCIDKPGVTIGKYIY